MKIFFLESDFTFKSFFKCEYIITEENAKEDSKLFMVNIHRKCIVNFVGNKSKLSTNMIENAGLMMSFFQK